MTGRGRPPVGDRVTVRLPNDLVDDIDAEAKHQGVSRAEVIRRRLRVGGEGGGLPLPPDNETRAAGR